MTLNITSKTTTLRKNDSNHNCTLPDATQYNKQNDTQHNGTQYHDTQQSDTPDNTTSA